MVSHRKAKLRLASIPCKDIRGITVQNPSRMKHAEVQLLFADLQKEIVARSETTESKSLRGNALNA